MPAATNVEPMIGPSPTWEADKQRQGRQEMAIRLREEGQDAAADYAAWFEKFANEWLADHGFASGFRFRPIPLPGIR